MVKEVCTSIIFEKYRELWGDPSAVVPPGSYEFPWVRDKVRIKG